MSSILCNTPVLAMPGRKRGISSFSLEGPVAKRAHFAPPLMAKYRPAKEWIESCGTIVEMVKQILAHTIGVNWTVVPQGSFVQGLQLAGSDLDLVLLDGTDRWKVLNRHKNADELETAVRRLTRAQWEGFPIRISVIRKIYRARVPLARLRVSLPATNQQVEVDLCFGDSSRGLCDQFVHRIVSRVSQLENFCLAMKVWASKRGLTETHAGGMSAFAIVLLAIFYYRRSGSHLVSFFEFVASLRDKSQLSVSVEAQQMVPRPADGASDFLCVAVPCRQNENAARCLTSAVWFHKVLPEIRRAIAICKANPDRLMDVEHMTGELLNRTDVNVGRQNMRYAVSEKSESSEDEAPSIYRDSVARAVHEIKSSSSSSSSCSSSSSSTSEADGSVDSAESVDSSRLISMFKSVNPDPADPVARPTGPISILECDECNFFSFNKADLHNHYHTVHGYPRRNVPEEKDVDRYKARRWTGWNDPRAAAVVRREQARREASRKRYNFKR